MTGVTEFAAEPPNELEPRFAKAHGATLIRCDRADYVPVSPGDDTAAVHVGWHIKGAGRDELAGV
jgi:hypothetical protein